jgi:hypothetical protein
MLLVFVVGAVVIVYVASFVPSPLHVPAMPVAVTVGRDEDVSKRYVPLTKLSPAPPVHESVAVELVESTESTVKSVTV